MEIPEIRLLEETRLIGKREAYAQRLHQGAQFPYIFYTGYVKNKIFRKSIVLS